MSHLRLDLGEEIVKRRKLIGEMERFGDGGVPVEGLDHLWDNHISDLEKLRLLSGLITYSYATLRRKENFLMDASLSSVSTLVGVCSGSLVAAIDKVGSVVSEDVDCVGSNSVGLTWGSSKQCLTQSLASLPCFHNQSETGMCALSLLIPLEIVVFDRGFSQPVLL
ncbi:hypothetical protein Tco_0238161 [Tanacetum coccineum]